ncbi:hypothetical protein GCM10010446_56400 [Streptomyces enissocaesilis]|uniref:Uncharacterized protein n=1 Tax=Streptomyces enissocaesilis TaxID=332589 RepID=A0ABN3XKE9_9ACTN
MTGQDHAAVGIDAGKPHPARMYDWFLGGKDTCVASNAGRARVAGRVRFSRRG